MNNKIIVGIVIFIALGAAVAVLSTKKSGNEVASENGSQQNMESVPKVENASIKSLLSQGGSKQCTFSNSEDTTVTNGDVFIVDGKLRGDFVTNSNNIDTTSHVIYDGTTMYMWSDNSGEGFKVKADPSVLETPQAEQSETRSVDINKDFNFSCKTWNADQSFFVAPNDVNFREMPAMNLTVPDASSLPESGDVKALQEAACNNLPEPAKTQCVNAIQ